MGAVELCACGWGRWPKRFEADSKQIRRRFQGDSKAPPSPRKTPCRRRPHLKTLTISRGPRVAQRLDPRVLDSPHESTWRSVRVCGGEGVALNIMEDLQDTTFPHDVSWNGVELAEHVATIVGPLAAPKRRSTLSTLPAAVYIISLVGLDGEFAGRLLVGSGDDHDRELVLRTLLHCNLSATAAPQRKARS